MENKIEEVMQYANQIKLNPVLSSNIKGIGYNTERKLMVVLFSNGSKYLYESVEPEVYQIVSTAESVGKTLNECIVRNKDKYKYHKLT